MLETIITSILAFASTNLDDIFILMLFFGSKRFTVSKIIIGQYIGIGALVIASLLLSLIGNFIDPRYIGFLGLFPIYLAIKQFIELIRSKDSETEINLDKKGNDLLILAGVTIANGSDNIGVYVPLFTEMTSAEKTIMMVVFVIMTGVWCLAGWYLSQRPLMAKAIERYGHFIMPVVLLLLGIFILIESDALTLLFA